MAVQDRVQEMTELLVARYGALGERAAENLRRWISGETPLVGTEVIEQHFDERHLELVFDAFWQHLPFGTGGRRGRVGYGANRMNETTVAMTIQGHCEYLKEAFADSDRPVAVVVANDVRVFLDIAVAYGFLGDRHPLLGASSRTFAKLACEIYAGNDLVAYLARPEDDDAVLSTPELSFSIGELGAAGGVILSASHNPPDDNGIKIYDQYGSQPIAPADQRLLDTMRSVSSVNRMPFAEALAKGLVRPLPEHLHERYLRTYVDLYGDFFSPRSDLSVVFTPLCGCGDTTAGDVLRRLGFPVLVPEEQGPDGSFAPIPFKAPNPEVPESTQPAKAFADAHGSGIVLSADPDADRVGVEVKLPDGSWYHMDGNQIAVVVAYALMLDPEGPRRKGLVLETLVTTRLLGQIAKRRGETQVVDDLLVGFKYMADILKELGEKGRYRHVTCSPEELVLATEESHGVMVLPTIRDKDATGACMYLAGLYQRLRSQGRTLLDYYAGILEEIGSYDTVNRSIMMSGPEGMRRKNDLMESLRSQPPGSFAGHPVRKIVDHWDQEAFGPFVSESDRLPRDVLEFHTDRLIVVVRPSGTEPKLKFYCHLLPEKTAGGVSGLDLLTALRDEANAATHRIYNELLSRIDLHLSEAALLLPDIIDLEHKLAFDEHIADELRDRVSSDGGKVGEVLAWLGRRSAGMLAGADVLPALKAPVRQLLDRWPAELAATPLGAGLREWASQP